jgi:hypothetical protein
VVVAITNGRIAFIVLQRLRLHPKETLGGKR